MQTYTAKSFLPHTEWSLDREDPVLSLDAVLPEQIWADPATRQGECPEAALMRAVLEDAIVCFQRQFYIPGQQAQRLAREAESWFFSNDSKWPFAFVNICSVLGFNPGYIRKGLQRWYAKSPAKLSQRKRRRGGMRGALKLAA